MAAGGLWHPPPSTHIHLCPLFAGCVQSRQLLQDEIATTRIVRDGKNYTVVTVPAQQLPTAQDLLNVIQAAMMGSASALTSQVTTPDDGTGAVTTGAINTNPFLDGTGLGNAVILAGKKAVANGDGIVLGMVGNGRTSVEATAIGPLGASSDVQTSTMNSVGIQSSMTMNQAFTGKDAATKGHAQAYGIAGSANTGVLSTAVGVRSATSNVRSNGVMGVGNSISSVAGNAISRGDAMGKSDGKANTLYGPTQTNAGNVAVSLNNNAVTQSKGSAKSGEFQETAEWLLSQMAWQESKHVVQQQQQQQRQRQRQRRRPDKHGEKQSSQQWYSQGSCCMCTAKILAASCS